MSDTQETGGSIPPGTTKFVMKCEICQIDDAVEKHHLIPRQRHKANHKANREVVQCCYDCARQVHMLFNEKELAGMALGDLLDTPQMQKYLKWKKKHSGVHRHKMSSRVKTWKKYRR